MSRWAVFRAGLVRDFLEADSRWLALFRVAFGVVLLGYLIVVASFGRLDRFYTDRGLLPIALLREAYPADYAFTVFRFAHTHDQALLAFLATGLVYLAFATGTCTRLAAPLAFFATASLHHRVPMVVNGSMATMQLLLLWSMWLPLGRHASVDAWIAARRGVPCPPVRVRSFAVLAHRLQLGVIYLFNVLHKGGVTWKSGAAVHYVLGQSRAATPLAIWIREHEPRWFSPVATYGTFVIETSIVVLVLVPFARKKARRIAALLMVIFHWTIAATLNLGPFPWAFSMAALLLLVSEDGRSIEHIIGPRGGAVSEPAKAPPLVFLREAAIVAIIVVSAILVRHKNFAMHLAFGESRVDPRLVAAARVVGVQQEWGLFAPNAPTMDLVLVPTVVLADGRIVDTWRHSTVDLDILDGRLLRTDFYQQTYDPTTAVRDSYAFWDAYASYLRRVPTLERWQGERRVAQVVIHRLEIERPAFGDRTVHVETSIVAYSRRYIPWEPQGRTHF